MHPAGVLFFDRVRDVSAGAGVHTYSCVRYATLSSVCTDYARSVSQADETGFYAPSVAHNALPSRPWLGISAYLNIILQYLNSFAIRSLRSVRALWQGGGSCI